MVRKDNESRPIPEKLNKWGEVLCIGALQCPPPNLYTGASIDFMREYKAMDSEFGSRESKEYFRNFSLEFLRLIKNHYRVLELNDYEALVCPWKIPMLDPKKAHTSFTNLSNNETFVDLGIELKKRFSGAEIVFVPTTCDHGRLTFLVGVAFLGNVGRQEIINYLSNLSDPIIPHDKQEFRLWHELELYAKHARLSKEEVLEEEAKLKDKIQKKLPFLWDKVFTEMNKPEYAFLFQ